MSKKSKQCQNAVVWGQKHFPYQQNNWRPPTSQSYFPILRPFQTNYSTTLMHPAELWHCSGRGTPQPKEHSKGLTLPHQVKRRALPVEVQTWLKTKPFANKLALHTELSIMMFVWRNASQPEFLSQSFLPLFRGSGVGGGERGGWSLVCNYLYHDKGVH